MKNFNNITNFYNVHYKHIKNLLTTKFLENNYPFIINKDYGIDLYSRDKYQT